MSGRWRIGEEFGAGFEQAQRGREIRDRMAAQRQQAGLERQRLDESRDTANATLLREGAPDLDTIAAARARREALAAGAPADTLSPEGAAADQTMTTYAGRMAGKQQAELEGAKIENNYKIAATNWMNRRVPAGQYNDKKAISDRMKSLETLRSYGKETPEDAAEYKDLSDRFNSLSGIQSTHTVEPPAPGLLDGLAGVARRMGTAIFPGASAAPATAEAPAPASGYDWRSKIGKPNGL